MYSVCHIAHLADQVTSMPFDDSGPHVVVHALLQENCVGESLRFVGYQLHVQGRQLQRASNGLSRATFTWINYSGPMNFDGRRKTQRISLRA